VPLWRKDHVTVKQLIEDFTRYVYLPRLTTPSVLINAVCDGLPLITWEKDSFAYADSFDEAENRYRGLRCGQTVMIQDYTSRGLIVKPEVASRQLHSETTKEYGPADDNKGPIGGSPGGEGDDGEPGGGDTPLPEAAKPRRFFGSVLLDSTRVGRDASRIAEEVIAHLGGLPGAEVKVTLEIEAKIPDGAPDTVVRTVTENSRTLKFSSQGFERE
jgi:hypothetical protein